jgi:soluble lytic murein transglycosylase
VSTATRTSRQAKIRRRTVRRRRIAAVLGVAALTAFAVAVVLPVFHHAVKEVVLPLRHEDIIRQQAREKRLDPALVAGVIFAESKFRDQTSATGAKGLMQIQPETAKFIAHRSGATAFETADLGTPQINIQYGTYYLRYLLDRYGENVVLAVAAYNGGETNVDRWIAESGRRGNAFKIEDIPFPETRAYVNRVLDAERKYRREYHSELGL